MRTRLHVIIPAGGVGSRLWPLSRPSHPKFLLDLADTGHSMLQETVARLGMAAQSVTVVTGKKHLEAVKQQRLAEFLPSSSAKVQILAEPSPRDSLPAIAWAVAKIHRQYGNVVVGSFAADQVIRQQDRFEASLERAASLAQQGKIITLGIEPTWASSAYGYIKAQSAEQLPEIKGGSGLDADLAPRPKTGALRSNGSGFNEGEHGLLPPVSQDLRPEGSSGDLALELEADLGGGIDKALFADDYPGENAATSPNEQGAAEQGIQESGGSLRLDDSGASSERGESGGSAGRGRSGGGAEGDIKRISGETPASWHGMPHWVQDNPTVAAWPVRSFKEKPDAALAQQYLEEGGYFWNAGIFVFQTEVFLQQLQRLEPETYRAVQQLAALETQGTDPGDHYFLELWEQLHRISIDHALAEPLAAEGQVVVVEAKEWGWSDVGDFDSLAALHAEAASERQDPANRGHKSGCAIGNGKAQVDFYDSPGGLGIHQGKEKIIIAGIPQAVVVRQDDAILVTTRQYAQQLKNIAGNYQELG